MAQSVVKKPASGQRDRIGPKLDPAEPRVHAVLTRLSRGEIGWRQATAELGITTADFYSLRDALTAADLPNTVPEIIVSR